MRHDDDVNEAQLASQVLFGPGEANFVTNKYYCYSLALNTLPSCLIYCKLP